MVVKIKKAAVYSIFLLVGKADYYNEAKASRPVQQKCLGLSQRQWVKH
jgi:hypothetical protein